MKQSIAHVALVVADYDEAIDFYTRKLHFDLIEDTYQAEQDKRWVLVAPPNSAGTTLLLAKGFKCRPGGICWQPVGWQSVSFSQY